MPQSLKIWISSALLLLTLSACKPGVYYPFGDTNAQQPHATHQDSSKPATQPASAKNSMIVPG